MIQFGSLKMVLTHPAADLKSSTKTSGELFVGTILTIWMPQLCAGCWDLLLALLILRRNLVEETDKSGWMMCNVAEMNSVFLIAPQIQSDFITVIIGRTSAFLAKVSLAFNYSMIQTCWVCPPMSEQVRKLMGLLFVNLGHKVAECSNPQAASLAD